MNRDIAKGKWTQMKGLVRTQWGKLTDDDLQKMEGRGEVAIGRRQERYGHSREEAEQAWTDFVGRCERESS